MEGNPVLSIEVRRIEQADEIKSSVRAQHPEKTLGEANSNDLLGLGMNPTGVYGARNSLRNLRFANVGISHETAEFTVDTLSRWWGLIGRRYYGTARWWLVCADMEGSGRNSHREWKGHIQRLANETDMPMVVCHFPSGIRKWKRIEHQLFSQISLTARMKPLVSYVIVVSLIGSARASIRSKMKLILHHPQYDLGGCISDEEMRQVLLRSDEKYPRWNYSIIPNQ
jgi:hypothetical protein